MPPTSPGFKDGRSSDNRFCVNMTFPRAFQFVMLSLKNEGVAIRSTIAPPPFTAVQRSNNKRSALTHRESCMPCKGIMGGGAGVRAKKKRAPAENNKKSACTDRNPQRVRGSCNHAAAQNV